MVKQEVSTKYKTELIREVDSTASFANDCEELEHDICQRIYSKDKYNSWWVKDFLDLDNYRTILRALDKLVAKGYIQKVKACPVFYDRIDKY